MHHQPYTLFTLVTTALAANYDIFVGMTGLSFTTNTTIGAVDDTLTFHFYPGKHNVVSDSFDTPCTFTDGAFYSGFNVLWLENQIKNLL
jgi:hypothetical protein